MAKIERTLFINDKEVEFVFRWNNNEVYKVLKHNLYYVVCDEDVICSFSSDNNIDFYQE